MDAALKIRNGLILVSALAALAACGTDNDDLDQYINEIKSRPGGRIEPLPEIATSGKDGGIGPDPDRSREFLEGFPLDTLSMVGTLYIGETMFGLVQTSDGLIHRVVPGNYLGQNDGRISNITESEIELIEIISDGIGGYIERDAAISLSD